jgi:hypothetical protein
LGTWFVDVCLYCAIFQWIVFGELRERKGREKERERERERKEEWRGGRKRDDIYNELVCV